jgi:hypothetical protein
LRWLAVTGLLLAGCKYQEEAFVEDWAAASCTALAECGFIDSYDACLGEVADPRPDDACEFDRFAAEQCVSEWDAAECDASYPTVCDEVYVECGA